jgi:hypothetical protein
MEMKKGEFLKNIFLLTVPTLILVILFLELFFRYVIPASEKPTPYFDEENKLLRSDGNRKTDGLFTLGKFAQIRGKWHINNYGWNSAIDYTRAKSDKKRICIIGDSYVRALHLDVDKNLASLLREQLSDNYEVYSVGHDGAPLSQYLHMSRYVNTFFDPDIAVFVLIHNDFDESNAQLVSIPYFLQVVMENGEFIEIAPTNRNFYQFLTASAIFRYLFKNVNLASLYFSIIHTPPDGEGRHFSGGPLERKAIIRKTTDHLIGKVMEENAGREVFFVMDGPREDIYRAELENSELIWMNSMIGRICQRKKLDFLDLTAHFSADYKQNHRRFDFEIDAHWNEYGHAVVSEAICDLIENRPDQRFSP